VKSRWLDYAWLAIDVVLIWLFVWIVSSCRGCDLAGVFYFCDDEGPHEIVQNPPAEWRARAADVQRALYAWTKLHSPSDTARFVWRDSSALIFVRVLGHGIPGAAARTDGDTILFNPEVEGNAGVMRHEAVHWVQPDNKWLQPNGDIHYPPIFSYARAPLIAG
jgi:hypothetical protein